MTKCGPLSIQSSLGGMEVKKQYEIVNLRNDKHISLLLIHNSESEAKLRFLSFVASSFHRQNVDKIGLQNRALCI